MKVSVDTLNTKLDKLLPKTIAHTFLKNYRQKDVINITITNSNEQRNVSVPTLLNGNEKRNINIVKMIQQLLTPNWALYRLQYWHVHYKYSEQLGWKKARIRLHSKVAGATNNK